jgi:hypothetical protein
MKPGVKYNPLKVPDLLKYPIRTDNFVEKIRTGDPFHTVMGPSVKLVNDKVTVQVFINAVAMRDNKTLNAIEFVGSTGKKYKIKDFLKVPSFGGRGEGSGTQAEGRALVSLRNQIRDTLVKEAVDQIPIQIGKRTALVSDVVKCGGTPKSDFALVDFNGKEQFWISHKDGRVPTDFQQYGSLKELDDTGNRYPDYKKFIEDVKKRVPSLDMEGMNKFFAKASDTSLIERSLFGKDYRTGNANGIQNIDVLMQGDLKLTKRGKIFVIDCHHTILRGEIPKGVYEVFFTVRFTGGRKTVYGIKNARFMTFPRGGITGTAEEIK